MSIARPPVATVVCRSAEPLDVDATDPGVPQVWFRGQVGDGAVGDPFDATVGGRCPSFADTPEVASEYAMNPDAAGLYGMSRRRPEGYADNANVAPYQVRGRLLDIRGLQGALGTQTGLSIFAARKILKAIGMSESESEWGHVYDGLVYSCMAKYGRGKSAFFDPPEPGYTPDSRLVMPAHELFDTYVEEVLREKGYVGVVFYGAMGAAIRPDNMPWSEDLVHVELRALQRHALESAIGCRFVHPAEAPRGPAAPDVQLGQEEHADRSVRSVAP